MEKKIISHIIDEFQDKFEKKLIITNQLAVGGGCISNSLLLESNQGDFFLKWNNSTPDDLFVREAESLKELGKAELTGLIIPKPILAKEGDKLPGYLLMDFLPTGHTSSQDEILGVGLAQLHKRTNNSFGFYHDNYCGATMQDNRWNKSWIDFFGQQRILCLVDKIETARSLSSVEKDTYTKLIERLPRLIPSDSEASLIHGDLWSGNYLYTAKGPALIDPASYYADREMELSIMTMFGGFSRTTWDAYQNEYPLSPGWKERVKLYQLYHILNHYYLFGGSYGSEALRIAKQYF